MCKTYAGQRRVGTTLTAADCMQADPAHCVGRHCGQLSTDTPPIGNLLAGHSGSTGSVPHQVATTIHLAESNTVFLPDYTTYKKYRPLSHPINADAPPSLTALTPAYPSMHFLCHRPTFPSPIPQTTAPCRFYQQTHCPAQQPSSTRSARSIRTSSAVAVPCAGGIGGRRGCCVRGGTSRSAWFRGLCGISMSMGTMQGGAVLPGAPWGRMNRRDGVGTYYLQSRGKR